MSLIWTQASIRIPSDSPMELDQLLRTPAFPKTINSPGPIRSRAGQWYNGQGYIGVSSPTYGTLSVLRQNSLTLDAVFAYDPFSASYAFSPIGFQGIACGGGNTENCRHSTSLKYRRRCRPVRAAALWQFGGYAQNNASNGAYQFQVGADIPTWGKSVLSLDAIYSYVRDSVHSHLRREAITQMECRYLRSCRRRSQRQSPTILP